MARADEAGSLVKGDCHYTVTRVEGLLHAIAMMDVNIHIQHARVILKKLKDAKYDIIDVAESRCFVPLGVVQAPRPIDRHVAYPMV